MKTGGAIFSGDEVYRYRLWRRWAEGGRTMVWLMLNPSTADAETDDPTIRRCIGFAKREKCNAIEVVNLYALRCTRPIHLLDHPDPEGDLNVAYWRGALHLCGDPVIVAAWGGGAPALVRPSLALDTWDHLAHYWKCLGHTTQGDPLHPLYIGRHTELEAF